MARHHDAVLEDVLESLRKLEHQAELLRTVLIVKEPNAITSAEAFTGLRKAIVEASNDRKSLLTALTKVAVAVERGTSIEDLRGQVAEWLDMAGIEAVTDVRFVQGAQAHQLFEDTTGEGLDGDIIVTEPAYFDTTTGGLLRPGRAMRAPARGGRLSTGSDAEAPTGAADIDDTTIEETPA